MKTWRKSADEEESGPISVNFLTEVLSEYGCRRGTGLFDLACAKVVEAHKLMNEARELVKQDLDNFKEEKSAFEKLSKTLDKVHFGRRG